MWPRHWCASLSAPSELNFELSLTSTGLHEMGLDLNVGREAEHAQKLGDQLGPSMEPLLHCPL